MATTPAVENFDWTFEQLSDLEKVNALVTEAIERASNASGPEGSFRWVVFSLRSAKEFIDADLATVPASMRPEVTR